MFGVHAMTHSEGVTSLLSVMSCYAAFTIKELLLIVRTGGGIPLAILVSRVANVMFVSTVSALLARPTFCFVSVPLSECWAYASSVLYICLRRVLIIHWIYYFFIFALVFILDVGSNAIGPMVIPNDGCNVCCNSCGEFPSPHSS